MLLVVDFVAEITKQKLSPEKTSMLRLKIFSYFAGYTDSRRLYHPNECLESFQYKKHSIKREFYSVWIIPRDRTGDEDGNRVNSQG